MMMVVAMTMTNIGSSTLRQHESVYKCIEERQVIIMKWATYYIYTYEN